MTSHSVIPSPISASLNCFIDFLVAHITAELWKKEEKVGRRTARRKEQDNMAVRIQTTPHGVFR